MSDAATKSTSMFSLDQTTIYAIVRAAAKAAGMPELACHDMRRSCARMMRTGGARIEQIQRVLGHASVQTTERYLGTALELRDGLAATDMIRMGVDSDATG